MKNIVLLLFFISVKLLAKDEEIISFWNQWDSADKIVIRTGSYAVRDYSSELNLIELKQKREIDEFKKVIRLKPLPKYEEDELIGRCMCHGSHTVEAYSGDSLIFNFRIHHFEHIRYPKSLDIELKNKSKRELEMYITNIPIPSRFIPVKLQN